MGLHGFQPMTPLSAALALCSYMQTQHRVPRATECVASTVGVHWTTLYKVLPRDASGEVSAYQGSTFSAVVMAALQIANLRLSGQYEPFLEPTLPTIKMRTCIGKRGNGQDCGRQFPDQGPHVRKCDACRKARYEWEDLTETTVRRIELRRFGAGLGGWDMDGDDLMDLDGV